MSATSLVSESKAKSKELDELQRIRELENVIKEKDNLLKQTKKSLDDAIEQTRQDKEMFDAKTDEWKNVFQGLQKEMAAQSETIKSLEKKSSTKIQDQEKEIEEMRAEAQKLEAEHQSIKALKDALSQKDEALRTMTQDLEKRNAAIKVQEQTFEDEKVSFKKEIKDLEAENNELTTKLNNLQLKNDRLIEREQTTMRDKKEEELKNGKLIADNQFYQKQFDDANKTKTTLQRTIDQLETEIREQEGTIASLNKIKAKYEKQTTKLEETKEEVATLTKKLKFKSDTVEKKTVELALNQNNEKRFETEKKNLIATINRLNKEIVDFQSKDNIL